MDDREFLGYSKQKRKTTMSGKNSSQVKRVSRHVVPVPAVPDVYGRVGANKSGLYWGRAVCGKFEVGFNGIANEQEALSHLRAAEQLVQQFYSERML